ncbi:MAG: DUF2490 domain-containing protein [Bacteroidota bacterium]
MWLYFVFIFAAIAPCTAKAQQANHLHSWWIYDGHFRIQDKVAVNAMYAWSRSDFVKSWQQSLSRIGVNFDLKKNLEIGGGYEWIERFPYGEQPLPNQVSIHRYFQKITLKSKIGNIGIANTLRFNQENINASFRYFIINQIGVKIPITLSKENGNIGIKVAEGIFINHGKWANKNYFGQNRVYAGVYLSFSSSMEFDLGYMNQYIIKGNQLVENNHTLFFRFTHQLDLRKKRSRNEEYD